MPRKKYVRKRDISPDPKYQSKEVEKFINCLMEKGKKSLAQNIFYKAIEIASKKAKEEPLVLFKKAIENARPLLEVKSRRVGGANYQVPVEVRMRRGTSLATRWIINFARGRKGMPMEEKLAVELLDAFKGEGNSIRKKGETHRMAEANRAFAHYRW